jgi:hypothetical protein
MQRETMRFYGFSLLWSTRRSLIKFFMTFHIGSEGCIFSCFISVFMQASVPRNHIEKFKGRLVEGHAYYLHYLEVKQARDTFRVVDHLFEAWFTVDRSN